MECLRQYLNELSTAEGDAFARRCKTTRKYLRKAINKRQELKPKLSVMLEQESGGKVTRQGLHPTDWAEKWPELAKQQSSEKENAA